VVNGSRVKDSSQLPRHLQDKTVLFVNDVKAQDFYQYPYASKWIAMNMLAVDPETVIIDSAQTELITILKSKGIDSIPLTLSHSRTLGGGFHCVTLDTRRQHA
jgi:N-dimethylarginine dimethylaminohydrolase